MCRRKAVGPGLHFEVSAAEALGIHLQESALGAGVLHQLAEGGVVGQQLRVAHQGELEPCTGHGHVELAVYPRPFLFEGVAAEEVELPALLDGETIYDVVPLAALESLYSIDADIVQLADAVLVNGIADGRNLVAVGYDDAYALLSV